MPQGRLLDASGLHTPDGAPQSVLLIRVANPDFYHLFIDSDLIDPDVMATSNPVEPEQMQSTDRAPSWPNLIAACAAITVFGLAFGMTYPLLSLILESRGTSIDLIGINAAMMPIGILLFSPVIPVAVKKLGARRMAIIAALISAVLMITYKLFDTLSAWFVLRLIQGMSISTLFVLSEAWVVGFSGDRNRGKVVAVYGSILSGGFAVGPFLISVVGIHGWLPFVMGGGVMLLGVIPLLLVKESGLPAAPAGQPRQRDAPAPGIGSFARQAPMLLAGVFVFAVFDAATLSLLPVYGIKHGLDLATAANILTALIVGNVVLQLPIGWLADRFAHRLVMAGCAVCTALALLALPFTIATGWQWPVLVIAGAAGYGVYTVSLASLGDRFSGIELINGSSAFAVMWGVGALLGAILIGWAMVGFGVHGLPVSLSAIYGLLVLGLIVREYGAYRARRR